MAWSYLAPEQDHWTDKPSSAPGRLAAVDKVLQLAHLHGALKPNTWAREAGQTSLKWTFYVRVCTHVHIHARSAYLCEYLFCVCVCVHTHARSAYVCEYLFQT